MRLPLNSGNINIMQGKFLIKYTPPVRLRQHRKCILAARMRIETKT